MTLKTEKDLYGTDFLKIIDAIMENLLKVENVDVVRSATRPLGEKLTQASLGSQITLLSGGMKGVGSGFTPIMDGITSIRKGIDKVAEGLAKLRAGTDQSVTGINDVSTQLSTLSAGTVKTAEGVKKLAASIDSAISSLGKKNSRPRPETADKHGFPDSLWHAEGGFAELWRS